VAAAQIFTGLRVSAAYVFATAATAEYLGARNGLGIWLQAAFNSFRTPLIFSATLVIVVLTGILLGMITLCEWLIIGSDDDRIS
jgi:ABC-type nitrate/sulfonate/bicarbonate transport system permease component